MKNEKQFVIDTLKNVYGLTDVAESDYISDEDPNQVDDDKVKALFAKADQSKVKTIKTNSFNDGAKQREGKLKTDIEAKLKNSFGITDEDFTGDDLDNLISHIAETRKPGKGALTDDELLKHPIVVRLRNQHQTELQNKEQEFNQKLTAKEQEEAKKQLFSALSSSAITVLKGKNPILPEDKDKAERRIKKDLIDELAAYGWMEIDGKRVPLDKDGKQLENGNGVLLSEQDLVEQIINDNFEFAAATPRATAVNGGKGKPAQTPAPEREVYTGPLPTSDKEYLAMISDRQKFTVAERASIKRQWEKKKGK